MRKIAKSGFIVISILSILLYIISCFVYIISPAAWWPMGIIAIGFPYTWLFVGLLFFIWLWVNKKTAIFIFILLMAGWPVMKNVLALHLPAEFITQKKTGSLRVLQWNCQGLQGSFPGDSAMVAERYKAVTFLKKYQPDILCLSEFANADGKYLWSNIALLRDTLGYKYVVLHPYYNDADSWATVTTGNAIFSKYPVTDSGYIPYPGKQFPEDILWAAVDFGGKRLRVLNTHLASMHLTHVRIPGPVQPYLVQDSLVIFHGSTIDKLKYFQPYHVKQVSFLKTAVDTIKGPLILGGDFNSVPSSYVYSQIRGNLSDAFLEKGSGFGRSFHSVQPALRIDYFFHNKQVEVLQWNIFRISFSDHDPEIIDVMIHGE